MAVKMVCDLCGQDAVDCDFILPKYDDYLITCCGKKLGIARNGIRKTKMNLCYKHIKSIADWIDSFEKD